jgi:transcription-repair coupling factor (superfamily II helicase)
MPSEINNLLEISRIKRIAKEKHVLKINQKGNNIVYHFDKELFDLEVVSKLIMKYKTRIRFSPSINPYLTFNLNGNVLSEVKEFLDIL